MSFELTGKVKMLFDKQSFASGFEKREFVVTTQEQYPQDIKFECVKEKIAQTESLKPGDDVKVSFNVRGNEYNGKYFVNLQAWKIEADSPARNHAPQSAPTPTAPPPGADGDEDFDDLPF